MRYNRVQREEIDLNINDVAREAGVSKTTVSRVLMGGDKVKPATKERVLEVIRRLNYTPNTSAQMLAKKSNRVLGVISTFPISDPFYAHVNDRIAVECEKHNYGTIFVVCRDSSGKSCEREIAMLYGKVDGYILVGNEHISEGNIDQLVENNMPVALVKTGFARNGALMVDIDNVKSGAMAANYLYRKGYRRVGYLHGDRNCGFQEGDERFLGFKQEMQRLSMKLAAEFYSDRNYRTTSRITEKIVNSGIDALFCETDVMAYAVVSELLDRNVRVPQDIAVLGFDDIKFRNFENYIRLSTVAQPIDRMAACVVAALVNRIENEVPYGDVQLFETKIVEGRTT